MSSLSSAASLDSDWVDAWLLVQDAERSSGTLHGVRSMVAERRIDGSTCSLHYDESVYDDAVLVGSEAEEYMMVYDEWKRGRSPPIELDYCTTISNIRNGILSLNPLGKYNVRVDLL